jgi:hypothetical protein
VDPCPDADGESHLHTVADTPDGLLLTLDRDKVTAARLTAYFGWVPAYRKSPPHMYRRHPSGGSLFIVNESAYLRWLREATDGAFDRLFDHYLFLTVDGAVDVLASKSPMCASARPNLAFNRTRRHAASVFGSAMAARRLT